MKRTTTLALCAVMALILVPSVASAKDKSSFSNKAGRFGIGYDQTLGGVGGISARFAVAKNFGFQAVVGFGNIGLAVKDAEGNQTIRDDTSTNIRVAVRGDVGVAFTRKAALSVVFGANIFSDSFQTTPTGGQAVKQDDLRFSFEAGLKAEYHFTDFFSVHGEVGLVFAIANRVNDAATITADAGQGLVGLGAGAGDNAEVEGTVILFGLGETFGNFGFTFWFK